jgi:hypothetical protein
MKSKLISFVMGLLIATSALAGDNSIYIQQAGDNATVQVVQDGAGNIVQGLPAVGSSSTTPAIINGNNNNVNLSQTGTGDTIQFGVQTTVANGISGGNTFNYSITGNNSTALIDSNGDGNGTSASNSITTTQTGNYSNFYGNVLGTGNQMSVTTAGGAYNSVTATQNGNSNQNTINISGGGNNTVTVEQGVGGSAISFLGMQSAQNNDNGIVDLTITGASNTVEIGQTSSGTYFNTSTISLDGSGNSLNLLQNAANGNTVVNLQSTGNNNNFTIRSNTHP